MISYYSVNLTNDSSIQYEVISSSGSYFTDSLGNVIDVLGAPDYIFRDLIETPSWVIQNNIVTTATIEPIFSNVTILNTNGTVNISWVLSNNTSPIVKIYKSTTSSFIDAVYIGQTVDNTYTEVILDNITYYFWLVSEDNNNSCYVGSTTTTNIIKPRTLTATPIVGGIRLNWIADYNTDLYGTEIWYSSINDRDTAKLLATVSGANTYTMNTPNEPQSRKYYFWVRTINKFSVVSDFSKGLYPSDTVTAQLSGIGANNSTTGGDAWASLTNVIVDDGSNTTLTTTTTSQPKDLFVDFSTNINTSGLTSYHTVRLVEIEVKGYATGGTADPISILLQYNDGTTGGVYTNNNRVDITNITLTGTPTVYTAMLCSKDGISEILGSDLVATSIATGVLLRLPGYVNTGITYNIDYVKIKIHYNSGSTSAAGRPSTAGTGLIQQTALITQDTISPSFSTTAPVTISSWSTATQLSSVTFTVPVTGSGVLTLSANNVLTYSAITSAGSTDVTQVFITYEITNNNNATVSVIEQYALSFIGTGNTTTGALNIINNDFKFTYGNLGELINGVSYTIRCFATKTRTGTTANLTVTGADATFNGLNAANVFNQ